MNDPGMYPPNKMETKRTLQGFKYISDNPLRGVTSGSEGCTYHADCLMTDCWGGELTLVLVLIIFLLVGPSLAILLTTLNILFFGGVTVTWGLVTINIVKM